MLESSKLKFSEKISATNFASPNAKDNTSKTLNGGGITDLPVLKALFAIWQNCKNEVCRW